ncbi:hypothetical protein M9H77_21553 [Catharanthus roseus]|uniref:Uncharacterized protein n=1 Tax=Catharanthus roseus TaxID=4058 RepID=A0ACC0AMW8_CATRO|nr:hypothetical protein M9H77_21553 [Catharanthus roseus]
MEEKVCMVIGEEKIIIIIIKHITCCRELQGETGAVARAATREKEKQPQDGHNLKQQIKEETGKNYLEEKTMIYKFVSSGFKF